MKQQTHDIINHTIAFWSERTGEECSSEDARQMVANVSGFFQVLTEWQRRIHEESLSERDDTHPLPGAVRQEQHALARNVIEK